MPQVLLAVEPVPAPIPLITVLHALTLALHWAAMNVLLVCAWNLATAKAHPQPEEEQDAAADDDGKFGRPDPRRI